VFRGKAEAFLAAAQPILAKHAVSAEVISGLRSWAVQSALYAQGRTKPGKIVTNARAGQSKHNRKNQKGEPASEAFDAVPLLHGKPIWEDPRDKDSDPANDFGWRVMGEVAAELGLTWYGRPGSPFREMPHFQL
jgi:peptidoglycan L-alanyl-D-glutamate endopeptidase CwlK